MPISPAIRRFALAHPSIVIVPAELLDEHGLEQEFAEFLIAEGRLSVDQIDCLERGTALYWQRCRDLFTRAPSSWFPPRQMNLLIVSEPRGILPYMEPFTGTSSLLYASDLDTHPEYVAYALVHVDRLALLGSVRTTLVCNLSYWFDRDDASRSAFASAAARARRPDARCFIALANTFEWIDQLLHIPLREPQQDVTEPYLEIVEGAELYAPKRLQPQITALCEQAEDAISEAMQTTAPAAVPARSRTVDALCDWLQQTRPHVIVVAPDDTTVWSPEMNDPQWMRRALVNASDAAVASLHEDLRTIDERSRQFLERVTDVDMLPKSCAVLEFQGGTYIDPARRAVVHKLRQEVYDSLTLAAPPYFRLFLGARVMHEWGHLAHAAKFLRVPDENKLAYKEARAELGDCFLKAITAIPAITRSTDPETAGLSLCSNHLPAILARKTLARVGDYLSNLMCSKMLPGEEMQAYVRTNVRHHFDKKLGLVSELARYAYEVHYLALADLPRSYFFNTSRFVDYFIHTGIITEDNTNALFDAAGRVLACYEIDEAKLALPDHV
jgi:AcrR family transcriptional regulator